MTYDVQIDNTIFRGISYAELIELPLTPGTFIRRNSGNWMAAKNCVELTHIIGPLLQPAETPEFQPHSVYDYREESVVRNDYPGQADSNFREEYYPDNAVVVAEPDGTDDRYDFDDRDEYDEFERSLYDDPDSDDETAYDSVNDVSVSEPFIPTEEYYRCKRKRRKALFGVISLGLMGLALVGVENTWRSNIFAGLSFTREPGMGCMFKGLSFMLLTMLVAVPYFIYSVFSLIYYSIRLYRMKH